MLDRPHASTDDHGLAAGNEGLRLAPLAQCDVELVAGAVVDLDALVARLHDQDAEAAVDCKSQIGIQVPNWHTIGTLHGAGIAGKEEGAGEGRGTIARHARMQPSNLKNQENAGESGGN